MRFLAVDEELKGLRSVTDLNKKVKELRGQIETLEIEKERADEDFARREREIEHKIGLERKRQEFEVEAAKREATVSLREENLAADRQRFESQMEFQTERFTKEVGYLKDIIKQLADRLPTTELSGTVTPKRGR
jgi:predicted nuclease with TOPRIM domain